SKQSRRCRASPPGHIGGDSPCHSSRSVVWDRPAMRDDNQVSVPVSWNSSEEIGPGIELCRIAGSDSRDRLRARRRVEPLRQCRFGHVGLDVRQRKFLWPDAKRLDLDQSVRRINQQYPDFPKDKIEEFLIYWIQELYVPEGYSESQMDELERLTEQWAKDH